MEDKKTNITDFLNYINRYHVVSARLLSRLEKSEGFLYNQLANEYIDDITEIDNLLLQYRNFGKKSLIEFRELREEYLQYLHSRTSTELSREEYSVKLRSDILKTLKTITDERNFVEKALLEKFYRDGIALVKEKNEMT